MIETYHFIGIGGVGMSGMARILLGRKLMVSGSDIAQNAATESLKQDGAKISIGHDAANIKSGMTVVYSTDIKADNPEFQAAKALQCPLIHRSDLLKALMQHSHCLAVAGTHGKTTTSSLLAWVLEQGGLSPSYAIGGTAPQLKTNAKQGTGNHFVVEACESDGTFLNYTPYGAILTNIDLDHMDFYGNEETLNNSFKTFASKAVSYQHLFWCGDDKRLQKLSLKGISYGFGKNCLLRASCFEQSGWTSSIDITFNGKVYPKVIISQAGRHNALNALAVFGMALSLDIDELSIRNGLSSFGGVLRRSEKKGDSHGILFLDDYAHHPTELVATLNAVRQAIGERRLVAAYQPHRYSRAKELVGTYKEVFKDVDQLIVTEIYSAGEAPIASITDEMVIDEIKADLGGRCQHVKRADLAIFLASNLRRHDVFISLGAGNITKVSSEVLSLFESEPPKKLKVGVITGGVSVEHEVALRSSQHVISSLRSDDYEVEEFRIDRKGYWTKVCHDQIPLANSKDSVNISKLPFDVLQSLFKSDVLFPVLHGPFGEDGTIQGLFEMIGKAYVGCDYRSSAVSMDKVLSKKLMSYAGIATSPFISFTRFEWEEKNDAIMKEIFQELSFPVFVKPTHLGSSVGVHRALDEIELKAAISDAFRFDTHVLVENGIHGREIEFSVLGNDKITVFPPGEVLTEGKVYDYENKYGKNHLKTASRADLSSHLIEEGMAMAKRVYEVAGCCGMARVDTFLDDAGVFWFNEINPIPGFTSISLFPKMCAENGLKAEELIDRLIILGLQRKRVQERLQVIPTVK